MPLPNLTLEQREDALRKAMAARAHRAEILAQLKAGQITLRDVFDLAATDEVVAPPRSSACCERCRASALLGRPT